MAYNTVPTVATGNSWSAAQHNTYIRDNFTALFPFTTNGDMTYQSSSGVLSRLAIGTTGKILTSNGTAPTWAAPAATITLADVYPVGSVYMSTSATSPATTFGFGTWSAIQGRMLIGADGTYAGGSTGGAATVTLSAAEMPVHTHVQNAHDHTTGASSIERSYPSGVRNDMLLGAGNMGGATGATTAVNQNAGSGGAHNNLPPYLSVYIWTRTA